jgi:hypothetical protein
MHFAYHHKQTPRAVKSGERGGPVYGPPTTNPTILIASIQLLRDMQTKMR